MTSFSYVSSIVALILAGALFLLFLQYRAEAPTQPPTSIEPSVFLEEGNLIQNPELQKDAWYLSHEKPGQPGLLAQLRFDDESACTGSDLDTPCVTTQFEPGLRVRIEGVWEGDFVRVSTLTLTRPPEETGRVIKLYYYNPALDQGEGGVQCSSKGIVAVERIIPRTITPIQDTLKLLLRGEISEEELTAGVESEFPLDNLSLTAASLLQGELTLTFSDPEALSSGGSCRVQVLRAQIESTARQFPEVKSVRIVPESVFQP